MSDVQPLSWKKIVGCAVGAVPIGMVLSVGVWLLTAAIGEGVSLPEDFRGIGFVVGGCAAVVAFLPLTAVAAGVLSFCLIRQRRTAHTLLSALVSLPIAILAVALFFGIVSLFEG